MTIQDWTLHYEGMEPMACQAPCTLYGVLYEHGKIPDPFYGLNERSLAALAEKDCAFTARFKADSALLAREYVALTFHGLDTICAITLNGKPLDRVKNMHRTYTYQVKGLLRSGENELRLDFSSPVRYFREENERHYLYTNDGDTLPGAGHLRKALYMSGWDWGPTLPDMGVWRPVTLEGYDTDRIADVDIRQRHRPGAVDVELTVRTAHDAGCQVWATLDGQRVLLQDGRGVVTVKDPKLWWARGYGEQALYELDVELARDGQIIDRASRSIGLRTLTVSTQPDPDGKGSEFCFVLNGVKVFAMGANYVPQDNLLGRMTDKRLAEMVDICLDANFNCIRVWGGAYYPDDEFFRLCDEKGLLVWLDFMIACANVRLTPEFEHEFMTEAEENLRRLRHHASLALVCGNNEMEVAVKEWPGVGDSQLVREDYIQLYERLLPAMCRRVAPDVFYWPSSPSAGGGFKDTSDPARGDSHYWAVWHGGLPFTAYRELDFRFCSEYGFESFPSMKTVRSFCEEEDLNCFSRVMENHQKCKGGNGKILRYLADNYLYPTSFENLVYASQLVQADAIRYGVQHFRRCRGRCMGSIYWQLNDCWPVASWSSVDYFGRYKLLHYAAKKFYAPVALALFLEGDKLTVNIANETRQDFRGAVRLAVCKGDFTVLEEHTFPAEAGALASADVSAFSVQPADPYDTYVYADLFDGNGAFIMRQTELFVPPKHFAWKKPAVTALFTDVPGGVAIDLAADTFALGVMVDFTDFDCVLSDNGFALTDGKPYRIVARTERAAKELEACWTVKTVWDVR